MAEPPNQLSESLKPLLEISFVKAFLQRFRNADPHDVLLGVAIGAGAVFDSFTLFFKSTDRKQFTMSVKIVSY